MIWSMTDYVHHEKKRPSRRRNKNKKYLGTEGHEPERIAFQFLEIQKIDVRLNLVKKNRSGGRGRERGDKCRHTIGYEK